MPTKTIKPLISVLAATVQVVLKRSAVATESGACDWMAETLRENERVLDWGYLSIGQQYLAPTIRSDQQSFICTAHILLCENEKESVIQDIFGHQDVLLWGYVAGSDPFKMTVRNPYEEGSFLLQMNNRHLHLQRDE